jgi:hypothetical protein
MDLPVKIASSRGVLEEEKFQITKTEVSGFSVPRCRFASDGISASLQQVSVFLFFFPDT